MIVPERVCRPRNGKQSVCPAFQIDDDLAPQILKRKWVFNKPKGYIVTNVYIKSLKKTRHLQLARVVFWLRHGHWPKHEIDHINRDKLDNRSENLRDVDHQTNMDNGGAAPRLEKNKHLPRGVYFVPKIRKFSCRAYIGSKEIYLGCFQTVEEAVLARDAYLASASKR